MLQTGMVHRALALKVRETCSSYTEADNITYREADCDEGGILGCFADNNYEYYMGHEYSFPQNVEKGFKLEKGYKLRKKKLSTLHMSPPTSTASSSPSHTQ